MKYFLSIIFALAAMAGFWGIPVAASHAIENEYQQLLADAP